VAARTVQVATVNRNLVRVYLVEESTNGVAASLRVANDQDVPVLVEASHGARGVLASLRVEPHTEQTIDLAAQALRRRENDANWPMISVATPAV
jgi:hypothetical protein